MERHTKIIFESLLSVLILIELLLLILVSIGFIVGINPNSVYTFGIIDVILSFLILIDFLIIFQNSQNRQHFVGENWFYIMAIVPLFFLSFNVFQLFNFKVIIALIGIIRIYALLKVLQKTSKEIRKYPDKTKLDYATFVLLLVIIFGSLLFFMVERGVNPEVPTYESAIWYTFISMATVGYGDIVPITLAGRIIGMFLILTGLAYVSLVTATLALLFIEEFRKESDKTKEEIQKRVQQRTLRYEKKIDELLEKIEGGNKEIWEKVDKIEKKLDDMENSNKK